MINNSLFIEPKSNYPSVYDRNAYKDFWKEQIDRCLNGYTVGGKYMPGMLYYHVNFWHILIGGDTPQNPIKYEAIAPLRDVEWELFGQLYRAKQEEKGIILVTGRDLGKSFAAASFTGYSYTFYANSESCVCSASEDDNKPLMQKIDFGLKKLPHALQHERIKDVANEIIWSGDRRSEKEKISTFNSKIMVRNFSDGAKPMACNGLRPVHHVFEEIGKLKNLIKCYDSSIPCWMAGARQFATPFLIGCVCAGTKVYTNNGKVVNVEDLKQEDGIIGYDGINSSSQSIINMNPIAVKPCYRITTSANNIIECSDDHPILSSNRDKRCSVNGVYNSQRYSFKRAKDLVVGDYLARIDSVSIYGDVSHRHARLIGLMLGDGYFNGSSLSIDDIEIERYITDNYDTSIRKQYVTKNGDRYVDLYIKKTKPVFIDYGLINLTKENKRLPYNIHTFDKDSLSALLSGIFDSDGNVYYNKKKNTTRIVLTNISKLLLEDVKMQLLKYGIHSSIYKENRNIEPSKEYAGQKEYIYRLYISKDKSVERFIKSIPIIHSKKVLTLSGYSKGNRFFGYHRGVFNITGEHNDESFIDDGAVLSGFTFESVTNIEYIGNREIYNLTVKENHTYIANGFITHNTGGDMDKGEDASKMFYDPEPYNLLSYSMSDNEKSTGLFFPGYMSFNQYRNSEGIIDKVEAEKKLREVREAKRKAKDKQSYLTNVMYYPLTPQECFLRNKSNIFNVSKLNEDIAYLKTSKKYSDIIQKGNLNWVDSQKTRVKWEIDDINGKFQVLLHPKEEEPYGLYVAGTDPYDIDVAKKGSSGSTFIFRRMLSAEEMYNLPVAQYTDRPDTAEQYYDGALKLLTYYNARTLCEAANVGLINYFKRIFKTNYLLPKPNFIKDLMPKSYAVRDYGVAMSKEFKGHMELWIRDYIEENCGVNSITNEPGKILFLDLLTELSKYNDEDNFDRVIAFGLCLGHKIEINNFQLKEKVQGNPYKLGKYVKDRNGNIYYEK